MSKPEFQIKSDRDQDQDHDSARQIDLESLIEPRPVDETWDEMPRINNFQREVQF